MTSQKLLDNTGLAILDLLSEDARLSYAEIARRVHLSTPAVIDRMEKMEAEGIITGYQTKINQAVLGYKVKAIVMLTTEPRQYDLIKRIVTQSPEVESCDHVAGAVSFVMHVGANSIEHLESFIQQFSPIGTTQTLIIMSSVEMESITRKRITETEI